MKDSKKQLTYDTLAYLKQEGLIKEHQKIKPQEVIANLPLKPKQQAESPAQIPQKKPLPKTEKSSPLLNEAIRKHLPHIKLVEKIPVMEKVLIHYQEEKELPFLKNLKKAIEERFYPCDLKMGPDVDLKSYTCVLSEQKLNHPKFIPLAKVIVYQENIEKKRALWNQICQMLSPKSF